MSDTTGLESTKLGRQFVDASKVFYSGLIALTEEVNKLPKDESTQRLRDSLRLVTEGEKLRTDIAKEAIGKFGLQMQGHLLELEVCKQQQVAARQQAAAN